MRIQFQEQNRKEQLTPCIPGENSAGIHQMTTGNVVGLDCYPQTTNNLSCWLTDNSPSLECVCVCVTIRNLLWKKRCPLDRYSTINYFLLLGLNLQHLLLHFF